MDLPPYIECATCWVYTKLECCTQRTLRSSNIAINLYRAQRIEYVKHWRRQQAAESLEVSCTADTTTKPSGETREGMRSGWTRAFWRATLHRAETISSCCIRKIVVANFSARIVYGQFKGCAGRTPRGMIRVWGKRNEPKKVTCNSGRSTQQTVQSKWHICGQDILLFDKDQCCRSHKQGDYVETLRSFSTLKL